ncbi:MAG: hypothetical protein SGI73_20595 [Chloroflexota bacterium]|nr:hypothetical protein [Chloroflexota bacterium]
MIAEGTPRMYVFIDTSRIEKSEVGLKDIREAFSSPVGLDIVDWTVIVGMDVLARFFTSVVMQLMNQRFRFMKDTQEAVEFLRSIDDTLQNMPLVEFDLESAIHKT